jgi:hypothetical protein
MTWENPPGVTQRMIDTAWVTTEMIPGPMWPWLDRKIKARREARRIRKVDASASEPTGPWPTLPDPGRGHPTPMYPNPMRDPERRW